MKTLVIVGAGGHGKVVADSARDMAVWDKIVFVDSRYPKLTSCVSWPIIDSELTGAAEQFPGADAVIAIGDNEVRLGLYSEAEGCGFNLINVIHSSAYVSPDASLAKGIVIFANSVVNVGSELGKAVIINTGAIIDHDCILEDGVHISPGANLAGGVKVGARSWVGIGASIRQSISIGCDVVVGAGSAVVNDVNSGITVAGCPAKT